MAECPRKAKERVLYSGYPKGLLNLQESGKASLRDQSQKAYDVKRLFLTYDISIVQDHNVIHLENADEKVDLVPRYSKL